MSFGELRIPGLPGLCCAASVGCRNVVLLADEIFKLFGGGERCCLSARVCPGSLRGRSQVDASMIVARRRGFRQRLRDSSSVVQGIEDCCEVRDGERRAG